MKAHLIALGQAAHGGVAFVIEVLSPSDRASMVQAKVQDLLRTGVKLLWYVDRDTGVTVVYRGSTGTIVGPEEELRGDEIVPGFSLRMRDVLDELAAELTTEPPESWPGGIENESPST